MSKKVTTKMKTICDENEVVGPRMPSATVMCKFKLNLFHIVVKMDKWLDLQFDSANIFNLIN